MFKLEDMDPVGTKLLDDYSKNKDGNFNPFHIDAFSMGRRVSKNIYIMFDFDDTQDFNHCYLINVKTGEKQRLIVENENGMGPIMDGELRHIKRPDGKIQSTWNNWKYVDDHQADTIEEMSYGFSDGEEPNNIPIHTDNDFVGIVAHMLQQLGGELSHCGNIVKMTSMEDTSGGPLSDDAIVLYDGVPTIFKNIGKDGFIEWSCSICGYLNGPENRTCSREGYWTREKPSNIVKSDW